MIRQKMMGAALALIGVFSVVLSPEHDATAALLLVPLGIFMIFTRKKVTYYGNLKSRKSKGTEI